MGLLWPSSTPSSSPKSSSGGHPQDLGQVLGSLHLHGGAALPSPQPAARWGQQQEDIHGAEAGGAHRYLKGAPWSNRVTSIPQVCLSPPQLWSVPLGCFEPGRGVSLAPLLDPPLLKSRPTTLVPHLGWTPPPAFKHNRLFSDRKWET